MRLPALTWPLLGLAGLLAARRWLDAVEVRGRSMVPALLPGDRLLVVLAPPRSGDVVLAPDPRAPSRELVKRVAAVDRLGVHLRGDNRAASTDARTFGAVPHADVRWRAVLRYWPIDRFGPIPAAPHLEEQGGEPACSFPEALVAGD